MNVLMNLNPVSSEGNSFEQPPEKHVQVQHEPEPPELEQPSESLTPELEQSLEPHSQTLDQPLASSTPEKVKKLSKLCMRLQKEKRKLKS